MSPERTQARCVAVRAIAPSSSFSKCNHFHSSHSGHAEHTTCGTLAWKGKGLTCVCFKPKGSLTREERLKRLRHRTKVYFDASRPEHQEALKALWSATYPGQELESLVSDQWKQMGWQGKDPSTDFRGAGFISLENLLFFAKTFSTSFQSLLRKQAGKRAAWEYPFAVAGVNITFMIMQMLDLDAMHLISKLQSNVMKNCAAKPKTFNGAVFYKCCQRVVVYAFTTESLDAFAENEWAFDILYCVAFMIMDKLWLEKNATYMEFNDILKCTRSQLEKELMMVDVLGIEEMPSYSLLC
ncbi:hypothetical protein CDL12_18075 [Handroanthus impetiginosus]|uniref:ELMO domain-containing protein n=1 Tax=Handroanthus impetiginosus TaxID=429701 RepID=A0A2G9GVN6_9LAMI|nr:hypothetical protein CDL12_18075 [Handroanthus impetiginosus]